MNFNHTFGVRRVIVQFLTIAITLSIILSTPFAYAQLGAVPPEPTDGELVNGEAVGSVQSAEAIGSEELTSCFDYYRFGSVPVILSGDINSVVQGGTITFKGKITNENEYPILNAAIYVKMLKKRTEEKTSFGPDVVDWFVPVTDIDLNAGESKDVTFTWTVPKDADLGNYKMATYVASNDRFNLYGLSFTNDVIGGFFNFKVVGEELGKARIDIENIMTGDLQYHATAFSPKLDAEQLESVPISISIPNESKKAFTGIVSWKVYYWDGLREDNVLTTKNERIEIKANSKTSLTYNVENYNKTVYYVVAELIPDDVNASKSFINVRFFDKSINAQPRINFLGVTKYPASQSTIFACVHSTGHTKSENVRFEVSARSTDSFLGNTIFAEKTYTGPIPGAIAALTIPIEDAPSSFVLSAKLYQDDVLIDEIEIPYKCDELGAKCDSAPTMEIAVATVNTLKYITTAVLILLLVGLIVLRRVRKRKLNQETYNTPSL